MNQPFLVVEPVPSMHGQFKRIQVSKRAFKYTLAAATLLALVAFGFVSGCMWLTFHSQYERLRTDYDHLKTKYTQLQTVSKQRGEQMASLETLASEISVAYGFNNSMPSSASGPLDSDTTESGDPKESIEEFNFLKAASYSGLYHRFAYQWQTHPQPSAWPLYGPLRSSFGERTDPFSGEGAFHTGIDLSAPKGTAVRATADGVVVHADWSGRYGKLVVIDHGKGVQTYYAHLSEFLVVPGEEVRLGEVIAHSGATGHVTAPHLHYEVRIAGTPVNPYRYLAKSQVAESAKLPHNDLGL
jgi:murein DD-endopeptidase MepM/ murein hydrolase activator NlpD